MLNKRLKELFEHLLNAETIARDILYKDINQSLILDYVIYNSSQGEDELNLAIALKDLLKCLDNPMNKLEDQLTRRAYEQ